MSDLRGKNVIICGRVSDLLREETEEWFAAAAELCKAAGAEFIFNPAKIMYEAKSHKTAVRACLGWMVNHANAVVMLPGWAGSDDAKTEYDFAHACGIEVVRITDLMADAQTWETTLGRGKCKAERHGSLANWPEMVCWSCSECGFGWHHSINDKQFRYCPNCGREIER